jgi:hypothetical protein
VNASVVPLYRASCLLTFIQFRPSVMREIGCTYNSFGIVIFDMGCISKLLLINQHASASTEACAEFVVRTVAPRESDDTYLPKLPIYIADLFAQFITY